MNVSSIIVKTATEHLEEVTANIKAIDLCDVHFNDEEGRIVVTVEGNDIKSQMEKMKQIQGLPNVYTVNLSYSYCEDELVTAIDKMKDNEPSIEE